jgi:hypothetical protein
MKATKGRKLYWRYASTDIQVVVKVGRTMVLREWVKKVPLTHEFTPSQFEQAYIARPELRQ